MSLHTLLAGAGEPIRVGVVGAGEFGATFIAQARRIAGLEVPVVCDRDGARAVRALHAAGHDPGRVVRCESRRAALAAIEGGQVAVVEDAALLASLPLDIVLEATGDPEAAAATATAALAEGRHMAMVTKQTEIVIGPLLHAKARAAGLVHTPVDGDQPSLLIGLIARAGLLGLPVIAAGKASESDVVYDPATETVAAWGRSWPAADYGRHFDLPADGLEAALQARVLPGLSTRTAPDLCEMGIVANHTGLVPDRPELHAPIARQVELARLFRPRAEGGLLACTGVVDMFNCLRRTDELSAAGGVFVVVEMPDAATGRLLADKGIPASPDGRYLMLSNPVHLLGVEAPISVLAACRHGLSTGGAEVLPRFDLIGRAGRDLRPGEVLGLGGRHVIEALEPLLLPARALAADAPLPYYLAAGRRVGTPVPAGAVLELRHLEPFDDGALLELRREQDRMFADRL